MTSKRTAGEASLLLARYEHLNADIPSGLRRQMGLFVIAPRVGRQAIEELFDRPMTTTPWLHRSWLWFNGIRLSNGERHWREFVDALNAGKPFQDCLIRLRRRLGPSDWRLLSKRMGAPLTRGRTLIHTSSYHTYKLGNNYWTAGGVWHRASPFTKIICFGEHLEGRDFSYNRRTRKLGPALTLRLEREVHNFIDEEDLLHPDALRAATEYVRSRIPTLIGESGTASYKVASWFFMGEVPHPKGGFVSTHAEADYPRRVNGSDGFWF